MVHRARPRQLEAAQGLALRVADGHQRRPGEVAVQRRLEFEILPPVERVHRRRPAQTAEGKRKIIYVAVDHVEVAGAGEDQIELADQIDDHQVAIGRAESHRARDHRDERRGGPGIAAGEERDVVAAPDQFFGEMGHDPFGPPVELRRHRLEQGRNLSDTHWHYP